MTSFEQFLLDKGYIMFAFDSKEMKYYKPKNHTISTMVNLGHSYIHNSDSNLLDKIEQGKSVMEDDFTWEDRKNEIVFGLREKDKPPTLISPRPRLDIYRQGFTIREDRDDAMNIALSNFSNEEIFEAMYNKDISLELKL